jgi:hypothetical protein
LKEGGPGKVLISTAFMPCAFYPFSRMSASVLDRLLWSSRVVNVDAGERERAMRKNYDYHTT